MFDSILVANRGEIALRIMRTAKAMGIQTIAIYVEEDKDAPHVRFADKAVLLPDGGYLDIDAVLDAAQKSNAGAIHPGYGFLSENSELSEKEIGLKKITGKNLSYNNYNDMFSGLEILNSLKESLKKRLFGLVHPLKSFL